MADRKPSRATLATRAFGKVQRLRQRFEQLARAREESNRKYEERMKAIEAELAEAEKALEEFQR